MDRYYTVFLHSEVGPDLCRALTARENWKDAWKNWRLAGKPEVALTDMVERFAVPLMRGEIGTWKA